MSPASKYTISFTVDRTRKLRRLAKSGKTFAQSERERAQQLIAEATARTSGNIQRSAVVSTSAINSMTDYILEVDIGSPATTYTLAIDTGSSNTWIGAGRDYVPTSTSTQTPDSVAVNYMTGSFSGTEFIDQVALSPDLVIQKQSIGVASTSDGFIDLDGLLGFGPTNLTVGTLSPDNNSLIPTVVDNLVAQGTIPSRVVSIFFEPTGSIAPAATGEMTFGGTDLSKVVGLINFVPVTTVSPSSNAWGVGITSINYGGKALLNNAVGIVDTGTTFLMLASNTLKTFLADVGAVLDTATGLHKITEDQFQKLQSLSFDIGGNIYILSPDALIIPRFLNVVFDGDPNAIFLAVGDIGNDSGVGFDTILGYSFLERFYSVYDSDNNRVGLAETAFTFATTNEQ